VRNGSAHGGVLAGASAHLRWRGGACNEAGIFAAPTLYAPAGGVSAERRWRRSFGCQRVVCTVQSLEAREIAPGRVGAVTLILIALGAGTFPPVWGLL
jgi:hypothetical protein